MGEKKVKTSSYLEEKTKAEMKEREIVTNALFKESKESKESEKENKNYPKEDKMERLGNAKAWLVVVVISAVIIVLVVWGANSCSSKKVIEKETVKATAVKAVVAKAPKVVVHEEVVVVVKATPVPTPKAPAFRGLIIKNGTSDDMELFANIGGNTNNQMSLGKICPNGKAPLPVGIGNIISITCKWGIFGSKLVTRSFVKGTEDETYTVIVVN